MDPDSLPDDDREALEALLLRLADDEFVLAERYTEWQVRAPTLESDLALANIAQDELGHARLWYDLLYELGHTEEELLFERPAGEFRHSTLVEQPFPEGDWADAVIRSYLYDVAEDLRLSALEESSYPGIADRVGKIRAEEEYHLEHAGNWLERLAADEEGSRRLSAALDRLFPHALTLFEPTDPDLEARIDDRGFRTDSLTTLREEWLLRVVPVLESLGLSVPVRETETGYAVDEGLLPEARGRDGSHTDVWDDLREEFTETYHELGRSRATRIMEPPERGGSP